MVLEPLIKIREEKAEEKLMEILIAIILMGRKILI